MSERTNTPRSRVRLGRLLAVSLLTAALASLSVVPALASAGETQQGAQLLSEVQAGKLKRTSLTDTQYEHVGQYLMSRALGSTQRYEAMDSQMDRMMGQSVAEQMYLYMGERYLGKNVSPNGSYTRFYGWMANMMGRYSGAYAGMMGGYMTGAYRSLSGSGSAPYAGMMGGYAGTGTTSNPTSTSPLGPSMMNYGYNASASGSGGWPTAAVVAVATLGALLLGGLVAFTLPKLRNRSGRRPAKPAGQT